MIDTYVSLDRLLRPMTKSKAIAAWKEMKHWLRANNVKYSTHNYDYGNNVIPNGLYMSSYNAVIFKLRFVI